MLGATRLWEVGNAGTPSGQNKWNSEKTETSEKRKSNTNSNTSDNTGRNERNNPSPVPPVGSSSMCGGFQLRDLIVFDARVPAHLSLR